MASNNLNTGGLEEAKEYMSTKEIPQLFESMMTALMYKKPTNHIEFLEDCLEKAKKDPSIKWHSFIEPLPPIPKADGKIKSEQNSLPSGSNTYTQVPQAVTFSKTETPLPPISNKNKDDMVVDSQNDANHMAERVMSNQTDRKTPDEVHNKVSEATEKVFQKHISMNKNNPQQLPAEDNEEAVKKEEKPWYAEYTERDIETSKIENKPVVFVLGGPGSGKGTQCSKIVEKFGFCHLSAGDLLRQEVTKGTDIGVKIDQIMKEGQLVPQDVTICLLKTSMVENCDASGFLIDGFPREIKQGKQFERQVCLARLVLNYDCPDDVLTKRLLARAEHSGRIDDNEETIKKRLALFHNKTTPVIQHYDDIVATIDADRSIEEISKDTFKAIDTRVFNKLDISTPIIFVIGGPGSGKKTQCTKLSEKYGFLHLSMKDLIQMEVTKETPAGEMIKQATDNDLPVQREIMIGLLKNAMIESMDTCTGYLLDGFPTDNADGLQFEVEICSSQLILYYDCPDELLSSRLQSKAETQNDTSINTESIMADLESFHSRSTPIILQFQEKVKVVNGSRSIDEVFGDSCDIINSVIFKREKISDDQIVEANQEELLESNPSENPNDNATETIISQTEGNQNAGVDIDRAVQELITSQEDEEEVINKVASHNESGHDETKESVVEETVIPVEETPVGSYGHSNHIFKEEFENKKIVVVIGGPGVKRHAKSVSIAEQYGYKHIYTGDLIKAETEAGTEKGVMLSEIVSKGEFFPPSVVIELISDVMLKEKDADCFIIDGFPRSIQQAEQFEQEIVKPNLVVYFSSPSITMNEQMTYDDSEQMKNRIINFEEQTLPLVEVYKNKDILHEISAVDSEEEIAENIKKIFDKFEENRTMTQEIAGKNIIFVLGGPGSGKGTQCDKIVAKYGFCHLSTGDLLREEVQSGTERAEKLKAIMAKGELVSQETILELLRDAMIKKNDVKGFLIDGFPRDIPQGQKFENTVGKCKYVLYFDCSNEVMVERLLGRAKTSGRVDDNEETIKKRLNTFENQTLPVLDEFKDRVKKVNAERGVDEIFADVCTVLDTL